MEIISRHERKIIFKYKGNLSSIEILENEPFIYIKNPNLLNQDDVVISQAFQELCRFYKENYERVVKLDSQLYKIDKEAGLFNKDQEALLNDRHISLRDMSSYKQRLTENYKKLCYAFEVIYEIRKYFEEIRKGLALYVKRIKEPEIIKKFEEVGIRARNKNISRPAKIVYKFSEEQKIAEYAEHFDLIQDDLKAEKEARSILEWNTRKITVIPISSQKLLKEKTVLLDTSAHKDTAESLTEVLPSKKTEEFATDFKNRVINRSDITGLRIDRREAVVQPSSMIENNTVNYRKEMVSSNLPKSSIIVSSNENQMGSSYMIDKETFPAKGIIITETETTDVSANYEKLRKEAEDLKRKNQELNTRLKESGLNQNSVSGQIYLNPTQAVTTVSKYPEYSKSRVPIKSWDFSLHKILNLSSNESKKINKLEPIMDIGLLAVGTQSGHIILVKISDLENITEERVINVSQNVPIKSMLYLNDGNTLLCGSANGKIFKINMTHLNDSIEEIYDLKHSVKSLAYTFNGYSILAASQNKIHEIDVVNKKVIISIDAHDDMVTDLAYNMHKDLFVTCSKDNNIKIWDSKTKECMGVLQGHSAAVRSICFAYSHDHMYLVSIGKDSFITFWNMSNRNYTRTYELNVLPKKVLFLWDKKTVLVAHKKGVFSLWDIEKDETKDFSNQRLEYDYACYLDDGHNVVLSNRDGILEFWNAK